MKYLVMLVTVVVVAIGAWFFMDHYNRQLREINARADSLQAEIDLQRAKADSVALVADSIGHIADSLETIHWQNMEDMESQSAELETKIDSLNAEIVNMVPDEVLRREIETRIQDIDNLWQDRYNLVQVQLRDANNLIMERNREIRAFRHERQINRAIITEQEVMIKDLREALRPKGFWASLKGDVKGNAIKAGATLVVYEGLKMLVGG